MTDPVYESDPEAAADCDFVAGDLAYLVPGNRGRLLDTRRTPIVITDVRPRTGAFELELLAFEDAGARWELDLAEIERFQFARDSATAPPDLAAELVAVRARFDRIVEIAADRDERAATEQRLAAARARADGWLAARGWPGPGAAPELARAVAREDGVGRLFELLDAYLAEHDLAALEAGITRALVSNPRSGEAVKGHAIVLAELGLCPYAGPPVRDPATFDRPWSREARAEHLIARMAFTQVVWAAGGADAVELYRGAAVDGPWPQRAPASLVSATFSRRVAEAHFEGGPTTRAGVLWRQRVPVTRLLMTFAETRAFNERFREAEAVLIGDSANNAF
jgi:hypothetical protein